MSNLGFSLDRHFSANAATRRPARGMAPVVANPRKPSALRSSALVAGLAMAASLFGALAVKLLF